MAAVVDDYCSYPTPKRATNWTLSDAKRVAPSFRETPLRLTNATADIEGAVPGTTEYFKARRFVNKPQLFQTQDIPGATAPVLHPDRRNKPLDPSLRTADIPRATPGIVHLPTQRSTDPLMPTYKLPSINPRVQRLVETFTEQDTLVTSSTRSPPRDPLKTGDIPGTRAKQAYTRRHPRDPLDFSDVPKRAHVSKSHRHDTLALVTADINRPPELESPFTRHTNPLSPQYSVPSGNAARPAVVIGDIPGSKSASPKGLRSDRPMLSLRSDDIEGARPGDPYKKKSYI
eukprot:CAMPEP_0176408924 /NCGR_PEP_ID=MMETSP0127-20121128/2223_1 /TAXON_ID=938130 /ORGANISM="Platyophrya macrostoma, Strain WH" /LENGTH=286 /DNA_ID=CAMNT_0017788267 /DNA_START=199 /DNA_END=1059 /DNA_ORIENTATION=+